ncbi:MAG TPA: M28 family peptidase, partial [Solirubrobacteraceae bacterium]|nr:M28 family peptidase [Solirubrobacteraceae bacterium]
MVLAVQLVLGGVLILLAVNDFAPFADGDGGDRGASAARVDRFDGARAMRLVREQVGYGSRPAGSPASRRLALRLRALLPAGRFEAVPGGLRNVVGSLPGRGPAIVLGAHYDTEATIPGHVGANDGAAGTAAVVEAARA